MILDTLLAYTFVAWLIVLYLAVPISISYYLIRHKFMSSRVRYIFAGVLAFNVLFTIFLVILGLMA